MFKNKFIIMLAYLVYSIIYLDISSWIYDAEMEMCWDPFQLGPRCATCDAYRQVA